jgi:hypothetical protein
VASTWSSREQSTTQRQQHDPCSMLLPALPTTTQHPAAGRSPNTGCHRHDLPSPCVLLARGGRCAALLHAVSAEPLPGCGPAEPAPCQTTAPAPLLQQPHPLHPQACAATGSPMGLRVLLLHPDQQSCLLWMLVTTRRLAATLPIALQSRQYTCKLGAACAHNQ